MNSDQINLSVLFTLIVTAISSVIDEASNSLIFKAIKFTAPIVGITLSIYRWKVGRPVIVEFSTVDWRKSSNGDYEILVPASKHKKGKSPMTKVYHKTDASFAECVVDIRVNAQGDVTLAASQPFTGRYDVK